MTRKNTSRATQQPRRRVAAKSRKQKELIQIVRQLLLTTLILSVIALVAAILNIQSHDFWEVIRAAIGLQGIFQGARMLHTMSG